LQFDRGAFLAWLCLGILWGSNFIFMKWAAAYITPLQIVLFRVAFGFLPVALFALARKQLRVRHFKHIGHFTVMALLAAAVYYYGFARGTSLLPSGIAGAVSGAIPLFSVLAAVLFLPEEKFDRYRIIGLLVGLGGVITIARPFESGPGSASIEGVFFMVIGSVSLGASFVYARKFVTPLRLPAAALSAYQLGLATLILAVLTPYDGIGQIKDDAVALAGAVVGLGLLGTGLAYVLYYSIVERLGAVGASTVTYLPPVVALLIGALFVGEPIQAIDYVAAGLILGGVALLNRRKPETGSPRSGQE
jgi:drug/metabolite transporter (DMT)-like permease